MKSSSLSLFVVLVLAVIYLVGIGYVVGSQNKKEEMRAEAIKAKVAYYSVDPETGKTEFKYKEIK